MPSENFVLLACLPADFLPHEAARPHLSRRLSRRPVSARCARLGEALYISTGGFSKEANYEAERANVPVTLIDLDALVMLLTEHYDHLDAETRALVPLKRIYWPVG